MTMTALKSWVNLEVLSHTDLNLYVGAGGRGQLMYATGSKAVALRNPGATDDVLTQGSGPVAPVWGKLANANVSATAGIALSKLGVARCCRVLRASAQSLTNNTEAVLTWDTEAFDLDGWHSLVSNTNRITPTEVGRVVVHAHIEFDANATGYRQVRLRQTGGEGLQVFGAAPVNSASVASTVDIWAIFDHDTTGRFYDCTGFQNSGGALNVTTNSFFEAFLLAGNRA